METISTSKGKVVIPSKVRRILGIKEGTHIHIDVDELKNRIILTPITREYIHSLRGKYVWKGIDEGIHGRKKGRKGSLK